VTRISVQTVSQLRSQVRNWKSHTFYWLLRYCG
jgi:hypothetical protein